MSLEDAHSVEGLQDHVDGQPLEHTQPEARNRQAVGGSIDAILITDATYA